MRIGSKIYDMKMSLYRQRVSNGQYLSDVPYKSLTPEARHDIDETVSKLVHPLMEHHNGTVWRFLDRN